jgi:NTP pyrophosphatase (non-canonical NTP hydrolase)
MKQATDALKTFRDERDWKQFHDPKNLATALGIEAAELNEVFLWKSTEASHDVDVARVREELADVLAYALLLADAFGLDPEEIVLEKVAANAKKYPVEKARGVATKYTDL